MDPQVLARQKLSRPWPCSSGECVWCLTATKASITRAWRESSSVLSVAEHGAALMSSIGSWKSSFQQSANKYR